jgi:DNA-binding CsgD family transcriptional regulator
MTDAGTIAEIDLALYETLIAPPGMPLEEIVRSQSRSTSDVSASLARLTDLGLVRQLADGAYLAVDPALAESQALGGEEFELSTRRIAMESKRSAIRQVGPQWAAAMRRNIASNAVDVVYDPEAIANVLMHYAETCTAEVLSVRPGRTPTRSSDARTNSANAYTLKRGVKMRLLYQQVALRDRSTGPYLRDLVDRGAQIRLANTLPGRSIVIDGEVALLPISHRDLRSGLAIVREPNVVAWVGATFEQLWGEAAPLENLLGANRQETQVDPTRAAILRLMGEGEKDEAISRKLSISVRTCRRHIADYMAQVGATSRFQAGVIAAREGHLEATI